MHLQLLQFCSDFFFISSQRALQSLSIGTAEKTGNLRYLAPTTSAVRRQQDATIIVCCCSADPTVCAAALFRYRGLCYRSRSAESRRSFWRAHAARTPPVLHRSHANRRCHRHSSSQPRRRSHRRWRSKKAPPTGSRTTRQGRKTSPRR